MRDMELKLDNSVFLWGTCPIYLCPVSITVPLIKTTYKKRTIMDKLENYFFLN